LVAPDARSPVVAAERDWASCDAGAMNAVDVKADRVTSGYRRDDERPAWVAPAGAEDINPYKQWHMRRAFRLGWQAAKKGVAPEQARELIDSERPKLNKMTAAAWLRGFRTQRSERFT